MKNYGQDFVIVFGSVPALLTGEETHGRLPRDLDVVYGGNLSEMDAEIIALRWAKETLGGKIADLRKQVEANFDRLTAARMERAVAGDLARHWGAAQTLKHAVRGVPWYGYERKSVAAFLRSLPRDFEAEIAELEDYPDDSRVASEPLLDLDLDTEIQNIIDARSYSLELSGRIRDMEHPANLADALTSIIASHFDIHRERAVDGRVILPTPTGMKGHAIVIHGDVTVEWAEIDSASSALRSLAAAGAPPEQIAREMLRLLVGRQRELNLDPTARDGDSYTGDGLVAFRNAVSHVDTETWSEVVGQLNDAVPALGDLVARMASGQDPDISRMPLPKHGKCAGGVGVIQITRYGRVSYRYGCLTDTVSVEQLVAALWDGGPVRPVEFECENRV